MDAITSSRYWSHDHHLCPLKRGILKEINRVLLHGEPEREGVNLSLLEHISPIGWENVLLYGEYVLNRSLVRP